MVVIRLSCGGAKKRRFYYVVAADKRRARDSRYIERLGYFNPIATGKEIRMHLDAERIEYWISQGAKPSERVQTLLKQFKKEKTEPSKSSADNQ
ncbi:MAG: Ribosomal protein S16 [uncultured bacterium]|nr:MAG: Ribosomal protein S16 [uncultured bacterium]